MKSERKKKKSNLSFLCILAYVKFFEEEMFVCSLFPCRKKELVVCRIYPDFSFSSFVFWVCFLSMLKKVFSSFKVIVLREAKVNAFQWIL